ncbi:MAG: hypothetical protein HYV09_04570 [Deltaproteobacteria bacterium]|nr:hypothetical protein [Deltaproteobacteria bacterium]
MRDAGKFLKPLLFVAVAVATLLFTALVWAADRTAIVLAEGEGAEAIAKNLQEQLPKGLVAGDSKIFTGTLVKHGHKGPLGKALDSTKTRDALLEKVRKAAEADSVDVVVIVRVKKAKKDRVATILVVDPKSTVLAREDEVTLPAKKGDDDAKPVAASVMPALEKFAPAPEAPPKVEEPKKEEEEPPPPKVEERVAGEVPHAMVIVGAGAELANRIFAYHQPITRNLRAYRVKFAPAIALDLQLYPLAGKGALGDIGIVASYAQALALQSAPAGGEKIQTSWNRFFVGLRYRLHLGKDGALLMPTIGWGGESFTFSSPPATIAKEVPAVKYRYIKLGLDGRVPLGPVAAMAGFGWLFANDSGSDGDTVASRFPHHDLGGVDLNVGLGYTVTKGLEAQLGFRYTRFFYAMNPEPGEAYVAGGALDHFSSLHLGAAYAY